MPRDRPRPNPYMDYSDDALRDALMAAAGALERTWSPVQEAEVRARLRLLCIAAAHRVSPPVIPFTDEWERHHHGSNGEKSDS